MDRFDIIQELTRFDTIHEIQKFNPYHGKDGRFSTADGSASFTYKPGQGAMYDRAIQREKERQAALGAQKGPSIAGMKPGAPMTHEQADAGRANPEYARPDKLREKFRAADKKLQDARMAGASEEEINGLKEEVDQRYQDWNQACRDVRPFQINCQSCVVAYEARRRGYDVEAKGRAKGNQLQEALARDAASAWIDPKTGKAPEITQNDPKIRTAKQATKWLEENVEPGGRYEFSHGWKGTNGYNGHIVTVSREGGALQIFDPQSGKTYAGDDFTDYMNRIRSTYSTKQYNPDKRSGMESVLHGRLGLIRVDGLEFNETVVNAVLKGAEQ